MKNYHKQETGKRSGNWVLCSAKKKCRLDGEHMNEFQLQQLKNTELVQKQIDTSTDIEQTLHSVEIKAAMERGYTPITSYGYMKAVENLDSDREEAARLIEEGTVEEQEAFIQNRIWSDDFTALLSKRDQTIDMLKELKADRDLLYAKWDNDPQFYYESVREKELSMVDANEELTLMRRQINQYKDINAPVVANIADSEEEVLKAKGEWREYDEETLNNLTKVAFYESGTREWLEQRQNGVGGSDIGPIMRMKGAYNSRDDIMNSKLEPISEEQVQEQALNNVEYSGALGRGNAWEKRIFLQIRDRNPEMNLTFCKTSWQHNENTFQKTNFDGLMADENGKPNGIVEIKTGSDSSKWGREEDGLDGVPPVYRAQTLYYAQGSDFDRGMVAVILDDREYRQYEFTMTPELRAEAAANLAGAKAFNEERIARSNGTWVEKAPRARGWSSGALNSSLSNREKKEIFEEVATLRGTTARSVAKEFGANFKKEEQANDKEYIAKQLRNLYVNTAKMDSLPSYTGIDLETSGSQPTSGSIIEYGASTRAGYASDSVAGMAAAEVAKHSQLYGLSKKALLARGTGNIEVHGINESQIAKKRQFSNPQEGERVLATLRASGYMLAHNASFERRWLNTYVAGFADSVKHGKIKIIDTMKLSKKLSSSSTVNDKLETFTARYGVPYVNSHRAYADAKMMCRALENMFKELRTEK